MKVNDLIAERGKRYGKFSEGALIMRNLKLVMHSTEGWERLSNSQQEALDMIQHKIGRVLNGDPNYDDNWKDIAGYATLISNEVIELEPVTPEMKMQINADDLWREFEKRSDMEDVLRLIKSR